jgi:hypothetical protein
MAQELRSLPRLLALWIAAHPGAYMIAMPMSGVLIGVLGWTGMPLAILGTVALVALAQWVVLHLRFPRLTALRWVGLSVAAFLIGFVIVALLTVVVAVCSSVMLRSSGDYMPYASTQLLIFILTVHAIVSVLILWGVVAHAQWLILKSLVETGGWIWCASNIIGNTLAVTLTSLLMVLFVRAGQTSSPVDLTLLTVPSYFLLGMLLGTIAGIFSGVGLWFTVRPRASRSTPITL